MRSFGVSDGNASATSTGGSPPADYKPKRPWDSIIRNSAWDQADGQGVLFQWWRTHVEHPANMETVPTGSAKNYVESTEGMAVAEPVGYKKGSWKKETGRTP